MDMNIVIGLALFSLAYCFILYLISRSRRTINYIANSKTDSTREILEGLRHGK